MNQLKSYPLWIQPLLGESLRGFMHRFALRNGVPYINWIATDLGLKNIFTALTPQQMERLSALSGLLAEELSDRQAVQAHGETHFQGQRVSLSMIEREASRLCLPCFLTQPFHRLIWDFIPVSVCPIHGTPIIRHCPECGALLHWRRNHLHRCPDGHSLLNEYPTSHAIAGDPALAGVRAICERMGFHEAWASTILPWSNAQLPVWDLVDMLEILGHLASGCFGHVRRGSRGTYRSDDYHLILARGYRVLSDWPRSLYQLLDEHATAVGSLWLADSSHPARKFLHGQLSRQKGLCGKILGQEVWRYAEAKGIVFSAGAFGFAPPDFQHNFVSSTQASKLMQISTSVLRRVARQENWPGATQLSTGKFAWLRRADVEAWCLNHRNGMSATELARRFHISQTTILDMVRLGLFGADARDRRPTQLPARWHGLPHEVQGFIDDLRGRLVSKSDNDAGYVNWSGFTKRPESLSLKIAEVVASVIRGHVRAISMGGEDLSSLRFNLDDALALARLQSLEDSGIGGEETRLPLRKIKQRFHVEHQFLMRAIDLGLLPAEERRFGQTRFWVKPSDMKAFLQHFTTIGLLSRQFGKSAPSLWAALRRVNVRPYCVEESEHAAPKLFSLSDIHAAGLQRILQASKRDQPPVSGRSAQHTPLDSSWRRKARHRQPGRPSGLCLDSSASDLCRTESQVG